MLVDFPMGHLKTSAAKKESPIPAGLRAAIESVRSAL
jgi:hypothetical protein